MLWPNGGLTCPTVTSPFGPRKAPVAGASTFHRGTDFVGFSLIRAVAGGRVIHVGTPVGWSAGGTQVWVQHDGFVSRYMHMVKDSPLVRVGQIVPEGWGLGAMGRTGNVSGVHLHLEIVVNGVQVDPVAFVSARLSRPTGGATSKPTPPVVAPLFLESEEDDMPKNVMHHMLTGRTYDVLITNPGSGFKLRYSTVDPKLNSTLADQYDTGDSELVDRSMFHAIEAATDAVRAAR